MPRTPDAADGPRFEEETVYERTPAAAIGGPGSQRFDDVTGAFVFEDDAGTYDPRTGGGISEAQHLGLDQLVHALAENGVVEDSFDADGNIIAREARTASSPGGIPIRRVDNYTFDADGCIDGYRLQQFDGAGIVVQTLTVSRPDGVWTTVLS